VSPSPDIVPGSGTSNPLSEAFEAPAAADGYSEIPSKSSPAVLGR